MARSCLIIILAAGEGTRMKSALPKVLHKIGGKSLLGHVINTAIDAGGDHLCVVVGNQAETVAQEAKSHIANLSITTQTERKGTAHAVLAAEKIIKKGFDDLLVLFGDTPLLQVSSLEKMRAMLANQSSAKGSDVVVMGFHADNPDGYGRLIEEDGELIAIREHNDASASEREIKFCNGGIMALAGDKALSLLKAIKNDNVKNEYYLTDCVEIAHKKGLSVRAVNAQSEELAGINDRFELSRLEALWQTRQREKIMRSGVTMLAPETVYLSHDTKIGEDVIIEPNIVFGPGVTIESGARLLGFCHIEGAHIGENAVIGPFARLRPGTRVMAGAKIGNFCEVKNAQIEQGAKINHLSYIGDARIGQKANIGAGTITCNYDGLNKHFTDIGAEAFIGTNSSLVAPVKIGKGAYIGSGSVITHDVPDDALAVARGRQANKDGYAKAIRQRNAKIKREKTEK